MSKDISSKKDKLYKELELKLDLGIEGINYDPLIFSETLKKHPNLLRKNLCMAGDKDFSQEVSTQYISSVNLENGLNIYLGLNKRSPYTLEAKEDGFYISRNGETLSKLYLPYEPKFYSLKATDGTPMNTVAANYGADLEHGNGAIVVAYSNECSLGDKGEDCLFCNINATKARYGESECIKWKYPRQIADTVKAAYAEGYDHLTITGGFIPERREVEYYLDTAEVIKEVLGRETFNGTACIGAPQDLSVIEKYKEAGFSTIGINMEVWNKDFFKAICPGKEKECGGYENWIKAIDYALDVFGKGNVRSNFVAGLEPKEYLLEGIEILSSKGVVATATQWGPNAGSKFEGHRTPTLEWHLEVALKITDIIRKNGITYEKLYNATPATFLMHDIYRIEEELLPVFNNR